MTLWPGKVALATLAWLLSTYEQLAFRTDISLKVPLSARSGLAPAFSGIGARRRRWHIDFRVDCGDAILTVFESSKLVFRVHRALR